MRSLKAELVDQDLKQLLLHLLGSSRLGVIFLTVFILAFLGWFADSLYGVAVAWLEHWRLGKELPEGIHLHLVLAVPLLLTLGVCLVRARKATSRVRFRVRASTRPQGVRGLILFLSTPREPAKDIAVDGSIHDSATRSRLTAWRMPLEAMLAHSDLEHFVILESTASVDRDGKPTPGSRELRDAFLALVERLWPDHNLRIRPAGVLVPALENGIDFFDMERLVQATDEVLQCLIEETGLDRKEIVIDVTGGPKMATAAGAVVALAEGRRFQYVDTHSYAVTVVDPRYEILSSQTEAS